MDATVAPALDSPVFLSNITALSRCDPALADRIRAAASALLQPVANKTRDGQWNFRLLRPDGHQVWFGATSIPLVRGHALLEQFQTGHANVLLPGIGEGTEAELLLARLGSHRAVFVWEQDPVSLQLAFCLHEFSAAIETGRLVLLQCTLEGLSEHLADWLTNHPGHYCPSRLMMWPWQSPTDLEPCRSAVEAAHQHCERERNQAMAALQQTWKEQWGLPRDSRQSRHPPSNGGQAAARTAIVLSLHASPETWALAEGLARAGTTLGWTCSEVSLRTPGDVHPLVRARRVLESAREGLDAAILVDVTRNELRDVFPEAIPAVCWLSGRAGLDAGLTSRIGSDAAAATSRYVLLRMSDHGLDSGRISVIPPATAVKSDGMPSGDPSHDVLIIADMNSTEPETYGIHLPTHAAIWKAAITLLRQRIDTFQATAVNMLVTDAERGTGVQIEDPSTRRQMCEHLEASAANALLLQELSQAIIKSGFRITARGSGWQSAPGLNAGPRPAPAEWPALCAGHANFLHADVTGASSAPMLTAATCGCVVLARHHPWDTEPGGVHTLLHPGREMIVFRTASELTTAVHELLSQPERRRKIATRSQSRCRRDHTLARRFEALTRLTSAPGTAAPACDKL
ncbi:MAG: hypothetical protein AMXMBFR13_00650 [Phycisphaerae bacterium]